ncbi:MAG TPA: PAS-domain containing protein, partial [Bauldia sp.]|nr:PAS-domain containing protein [Bauldia sp.]
MRRKEPGSGRTAPATEAMIMLEDALSRMPYGISAWSEDFRLLFWNDAYLRLYDIPPEAMLPGMSLRERIEMSVAVGNHPGESIDYLVARHRRRLEASRDPASPAVYVDKVGERLIERTYLPSPGHGWIVVHEDETAQHRREADLQAQHRRLDAALDSMSYGFCLFDSDFRLVLWNAGFIDLYRLDRKEIVAGMPLIEVFLASIAAGNHQGWTAGEMAVRERARLSSLGPGETLVSEAVLESGRIVEIRWKRTPDGSWVSTHEDVTDERDRVQALERREAELKRQNMRFEAAVNHMSQGLCMFDAQQELIICNKRYADLYGLPPELVVPGTTLMDILRYRMAHGFHPKDGAEDYIRKRLDMVAKRQDAVDTVELQDGRVISVIHHPLPDGGWVSTHEDVTEQRRNEARIRHLARHDALTDLPNRMQFRERMEQAEDLIASGHFVAVLFIDLDHFKSVNDLYGHGVGDVVLKQVSQRLLASCREGDFIARLGGDEFAVLQTALGSPQDAAALADRIVRTMSVPLQVQGQEIILGASVGIAVAPNDGRDAETLMKNADLAAYRAKADGRGAYHFFEPGLDAALQERLAFETELRGALARNELMLVFQPLFSLRDNRISGVEALIRWNHPRRGVVMPDRLIPAAEKSGLIGPIGEWALREACLAAASWPEHISVAVNVSPIQFVQRSLIRHVKEALRISGIAPNRLDIEVTESALLADNEMTLGMLGELRNIGVGISLDDFGTGYSSLGYLRAFPFDKIKIDRSFVHDLASHRDSLAIIKAVIAL